MNKFIRWLLNKPILAHEITANKTKYITNFTDITVKDKFCPECGRKIIDRFEHMEYNSITGESTKIIKRACPKGHCEYSISLCGY